MSTPTADGTQHSPMSLRIKEATRTSLERLAKADDRSVSYLARLAIEEYVARREQTA